MSSYSKYIVFIALSIISISSLVSQELPFTYYTPSSELHPLPSSTVNNLMQDSEGFLWLCVYGSAMVRYDGQRMELYNDADGIFGLTVMCALQDQKGRLWVASDLGISISRKSLEQYGIGERVQFTSTIGTTSLVHTSISQIAPNCLTMDRDGAVYVATTGLGVLRYYYHNEDQLAVDTLSTFFGENNSNSTVYVVFGANDGTVWAGVNGGLMMYDKSGDRFVQFPSQDRWAKSQIHSLAKMSDGTLWGGTSNGVVWKLEYRNGTNHFSVVEDTLTGIVYGIKEDGRRRAWITSYNSAVMEINLANPLERNYYTRQQGLLGNNVRSSFIDREENIWFSYSAGVSKLQKNYRAFLHYTSNSSAGKPLLPVPDASGIDVSTSTLWACSGNGITSITPDKRSATIGVENGLSSNTTYDVHVDNNHHVWIGTFSGLNCLTFDGVQPPALHSGSVRTITINGKKALLTFYDVGIIGVCNSFPMKKNSFSQAADEVIWFNSYKSVVCFVDGQWYVFDEQSGLPASIMYSLAVDSSGYVYIGTGDKGLYRSIQPLTISLVQQYVENGKGMSGRSVQKVLFKPYWNRTNGAPTNEIQELLWVNNTLWVGTPKAVFALADGSISSIDSVQPANGRTNVGGYCGAYNPVTNTLWFINNQGLEEIDPNTKRVVRVVTKDNGLLNNEANWLDGIGVDKNGKIFVSHPSGISVYQPGLDEKNEVAPSLVMLEAGYSEDLRGNNEFSVKYAALSYANENLVRYRTRLVGYDKDWSQPKIDTRIRYTNLSAYLFNKEYAFEVIACNNSSVWNATPVRYTLSVTPPVWFRWWAFIFYSIGAFGFVRGAKWSVENIRVMVANSKSRYISHFKIIELLGAGGMGKVYKAVDINTKSIVALKILNPELLKDPENRKRLSAEGHLLASFKHPNIVKVFEIGESNERGFIAMEYLSGGTLKQKLEKDHPLSIAEIKNYLLQVCDGLSEVHKNGIVHRDLKTGNLMLTDENKIRIMDFGLSKSPLVTTMTSLGTVLGTLGYVAPEQVTSLNVDQRTDIFSLGVIIYELLTNEMPFKGENEIALIHSIFNTVPPVPSSLRNDVPKEWDEIVMKCLARDVSERFANVEDVKNNINHIET